MSSSLLAALFSILGLGLAVTSSACLVLWRQVRLLTSQTSVPGSSPRQLRTTIAIPEIPQRPARTRFDLSRRLDDLAVEQRALEVRLARLEESTAQRATALSHRAAPSNSGRRVDPGQPATSEGPTLISVPNLASPPSSTQEAASELDRRFGPVWAMSDDGIPTEAIARESGYPIGQVELILGLRRRIGAVGTSTDG